MNKPTIGDTPLRVFLSYSRRDAMIMHDIAQQLLAEGFAPDFDKSDLDPRHIDGGISAEDDWWLRIRELISSSDVMVFLVSPDSAASKVCDEEIAYARMLGKRIIPVLVRPIDYSRCPPRLSALNIKIDFTSMGSNSENAQRALADALNTDVYWHRQGRKYQQQISDWNLKGRPRALLFDAQALQEAEAWAARRPRAVDDVGQLFHEFVAAAHGEENMRREYRKARLEALERYVEPALKTRADQLSHEASTKNQFMDKESDLLAEIRQIENFIGDKGRWHPEPAKLSGTLGPRGDYCDIYTFPCCGASVKAGDRVPSQFRSDGCEGPPT